VNQPPFKPPPGIRLFTPPPLNSLLSTCPEVAHLQSRFGPLDESLYRHEEVICRWSESTPWHLFKSFIQSLDTNSPVQILVLPSNTDHLNLLQAPYSISTQPRIRDNTGMIQGLGQSLMKQWHDDLLRAAFESRFSGFVTERARIIPGHYLPPKQGDCDIDIPNIMALSSKSSHLEILKYAVYLMTNNFQGTERMASVIVDLAQQRTNCQLIRGLFDQKVLIMEAFAEKLLFSAVRERTYL
jgi:hypothetical protein